MTTPSNHVRQLSSHIILTRFTNAPWTAAFKYQIKYWVLNNLGSRPIFIFCHVSRNVFENLTVQAWKTNVSRAIKNWWKENQVIKKHERCIKKVTKRKLTNRKWECSVRQECNSWEF